MSQGSKVPKYSPFLLLQAHAREMAQVSGMFRRIQQNLVATRANSDGLKEAYDKLLRLTTSPNMIRVQQDLRQYQRKLLEEKRNKLRAQVADKKKLLEMVTDMDEVKERLALEEKNRKAREDVATAIAKFNEAKAKQREILGKWQEKINANILKLVVDGNELRKEETEIRRLEKQQEELELRLYNANLRRHTLLEQQEREQQEREHQAKEQQVEKKLQKMIPREEISAPKAATEGVQVVANKFDNLLGFIQAPRRHTISTIGKSHNSQIGHPVWVPDLKIS